MKWHAFAAVLLCGLMALSKEGETREQRAERLRWWHDGRFSSLSPCRRAIIQVRRNLRKMLDGLLKNIGTFSFHSSTFI